MQCLTGTDCNIWELRIITFESHLKWRLRFTESNLFLVFLAGVGWCCIQIIWHGRMWHHRQLRWDMRASFYLWIVSPMWFERGLASLWWSRKVIHTHIHTHINTPRCCADRGLVIFTKDAINLCTRARAHTVFPIFLFARQPWNKHLAYLIACPIWPSRAQCTGPDICGRVWLMYECRRCFTEYAFRKSLLCLAGSWVLSATVRVQKMVFVSGWITSVVGASDYWMSRRPWSEE